MSYPQSSLNIDPSKFSSLQDVKPTIQPKDTFLTSVSKWIRTNIQKPVDLKSPGRYAEHDREAKNVFISPNELGDGVSVSVGRPIAQSSYHDVAVSHGISVGSMMRPPEYTLGYTFSNVRGQMYAQVTSTGVFIANLKQKYLKRRLGIDCLYVNANDTLQFKTEYNGDDNVTNAEWHHDNGKFVLGYMQSVLRNLDLGTSAYYKTSDRKSGLSTAARYHEGDLVLTGEYTVRGSSENNDHIFRGTYYERIDNSTVMVAEVTYDFTENDSKFQYGFQQNYMNGRYRVTADNAFQIRGVFEHKVSPIGNVQCTVDADPTKSEFKFGFNIQFG